MSEFDAGANGRVLIVDDEKSTRLLVREVLEPAGFEVHEAADGETGLSEYAALQPDLMLLDVVMPGMSGFDVLERLRSATSPSGCPVVMITGLDDRNAIDMAYERGASDFITKPINWPLLRQRVRYLVRAARGANGDGQATGRLDTIERAARVGVWSWNPETGVVDGSDGFRRLLGPVASGRLSRRRLLGCIPWADRAVLLEKLRGAAECGHDMRVDVRVDAGGGERIVEVVAELSSRRESNSRVVTGTAQDVTGRRHVEDRLRRDHAAALEALAAIHTISERDGLRADEGEHS